jgi:1-deoxy-D-xylulose 5-phosphate reductoisomerase
LERRIDFLAIPSIIEAVMNKHKVVLNPGIEELVAADHEARANALAAAERKRL